MLTEVERARLIVCIDNITRDKQELEEKLRQSEADFMAAWTIYGSELAGDATSSHLRRQIEAKVSTLKLLEQYRDGNLDISERGVQDLRQKQEYLLAESLELAKRLEKIAKTLSDIEQVRQILSSKT